MSSSNIPVFVEVKKQNKKKKKKKKTWCEAFFLLIYSVLSNNIHYMYSLESHFQAYYTQTKIFMEINVWSI